jgi:type I restriction enzyme, S subunit
MYKEVVLSEIADFISGFAFPSSKFIHEKKEGLLPIIRIQNVNSCEEDFVYWNQEYNKKFLVYSGDLLLSMSGDFKITIWDKETALLNQRIVKIVPKEVELSYMLFLIENKIDELTKLGKKSIISNLSLADLKNLKVQIPVDRVVQGNIAETLNKTLNIIKKRQSQIEALDELTQSVFLRMFGDPTRSSKWDIKLFKDICDSKLGKMLDKQKQEGLKSKAYYLGNRHVQWGRFELEDLPKMGFKEEELEKYSLQKGDILICEGGEVGRCAIWQWDNKEIYYQKALHRARIKNNLVAPEYLQNVMYLYSKRGGFKDFTTTATIAHLTAAKLNMLPIPVPPKELQDEFTSIYYKIQHEKELLIKGKENLKTLYNSLLQSAFKGEMFQEYLVK